MAKTTSLRKAKPRNRHDELEEAQEAAMRADQDLQRFKDKYYLKYPGDQRLRGAGLTRPGADEVKLLTQEQRSRADQRYADRYREDTRTLGQLWAASDEASRRVREIQSAIAEEFDEASARAELAAAIKNAKSEDGLVRDLRTSLKCAEATVATAEIRHSEATAAIQAAIDAQARTFEAAFEQGHSADRDGSVRDAKATEAELAEYLAGVRSAADALRDKLDLAEHSLSQHQKKIPYLAGRVMAARLPNLIEEAKSAQRELEGKRTIVRYLSRFASRETCDEADEFLAAKVFPFDWTYKSPEEHSAFEPWGAALVALQCDADAPLPKAKR